jgi:cytochrome c-type biogenesis protein
MSPLLILTAFGAGFASVLSPCVLPVLPIVAAGSEQDHKWRPILLTLGLSASFVGMGILSSLAGSWLAGKMRFIEIVAGGLVALIGLLLLLGVDAFKRLSLLQQFSPKVGAGPFSGFLLGMALGLVWIPCVGPFLSSVLAMVASQGSMQGGVALLLFYSLGFSVPVLVAGYASRWFRAKTKVVRKYAMVVRIAGGLLLVALGMFIAVQGTYGLGSLSF